MKSATLTIRRLPLSRLKPHPKNPRRHPEPGSPEWETLKKSLAHDYFDPIVWNKRNGMLVSGHLRTKVLAASGYGEADCVVVDYDEPTHVARMIAANRLIGENDEKALTEALLGLQAEGIDLDLTGFDSQTLSGLDGFSVAPESDDEHAGELVDKAAELNKVWKVKTGDLWELGEHRLLCGSALEATDTGRLLGQEKTALVSDPPYGINVDTSWLTALNVKRGKPANMSDAKLAGDDGKLDLSWVYSWPEWLLFGFPFVARREAFTGLLIWDKRGDGGERGLGNPVEVAASNAFQGYRLSRHVWAGYVREAGEKRQPHPTQKPLGIMVDAINFVHEKVIYDPFLGSGTTLIACEQLNRRCRAIEISPDYCAVALQRWTDLTGKTPKRIK